MIVLNAEHTVRYGQGDEVRSHVRTVASLVEAKPPGCRIYRATQSTDDNHALVLIEHYSDRHAADIHWRF
jgi:quinol monooxygenase YgiN